MRAVVGNDGGAASGWEWHVHVPATRSLMSVTDGGSGSSGPVDDPSYFSGSRGPVDDPLYVEGERNRALERIVSVDFAVTSMRGVAMAAQVLALVGVAVWGVITYLQWHQFHVQHAPTSEQALGALQPFSFLLFAAVLGTLGVGCQLAANWINLRLTSEYLSEEEDEGDEGT